MRYTYIDYTGTVSCWLLFGCTQKSIFLWSCKFHYHHHKSALLNHILDHFTVYFSKLCHNYPSVFSSPQYWYIAMKIWIQNILCRSCIFIRFTCPCNLVLQNRLHWKREILISVRILPKNLVFYTSICMKQKSSVIICLEICELYSKLAHNIKYKYNYILFYAFFDDFPHLM
jgi:hypothetical protein